MYACLESERVVKCVHMQLLLFFQQTFVFVFWYYFWDGKKKETYPSCVRSWGWYVVMKYVFVYCSSHVRLIMFLTSFFPCLLKLEASKCIIGLVLTSGFWCWRWHSTAWSWCVNICKVAAPGGRCSVSGEGDLGLAGILAPSSPLGHGAGFLFLGLSNPECMVPPGAPYVPMGPCKHIGASPQLPSSCCSAWCQLAEVLVFSATTARRC